MRMKRTKTRTGSSLLAILLLVAAAFDGYGKDKKPPEPYAVIAGTTFRPPGFALPGARVRITPESDASGSVKLKSFEAQTDARGEFAFRVPVVPMKWTVNVQFSGYQAQTKAVSVDGEQRVDLSFQLEPAPGKPKEN
jgi:hypothetical protein